MHVVKVSNRLKYKKSNIGLFWFIHLKAKLEYFYSCNFLSLIGILIYWFSRTFISEGWCFHGILKAKNEGVEVNKSEDGKEDKCLYLFCFYFSSVTYCKMHIVRKPGQLYICLCFPYYVWPSSYYHVDNLAIGIVQKMASGDGLIWGHKWAYLLNYIIVFYFLHSMHIFLDMNFKVSKLYIQW